MHGCLPDLPVRTSYFGVGNFEQFMGSQAANTDLLGETCTVTQLGQFGVIKIGHSRK